MTDYEVREATVYGRLVGLYRSEGPVEPGKGGFITVAGGRWCVIDGPFYFEGAGREHLLVVAPVSERRAEKGSAAE